MTRPSRTKFALLTSSVAIALAGCTLSPVAQSADGAALSPSMSSQSSDGVLVEGASRLVSFVEDNQVFEIRQQLVCAVPEAAQLTSSCSCSWVAQTRVPVAGSAATPYDGNPCVELTAQSTQELRDSVQPGTGAIIAGAGLLLLLGLAGGGGGGGAADGT